MRYRGVMGSSRKQLRVGAFTVRCRAVWLPLRFVQDIDGGLQGPFAPAQMYQWHLDDHIPLELIVLYVRLCGGVWGVPVIFV